VLEVGMSNGLTYVTLRKSSNFRSSNGVFILLAT
jgi:hypothetical protein